MEAVSFSSDALAMEKLIVSSFAEAMVADTFLAAQRSLACFLMVTEALLKDGDILPNLIGADQRFPVDELHRRKRPEPENKDGSDTEDDDEEDDDDADQDDDDAGDEDFSGEEGGENDEEVDPEEEPVANGNGGSDDDDDDDDDEDEDEDDDDDGDEDGDRSSNVERTKGGIITMPFIFANEICEKLAVVGFSANMISYLTLQLHLPLTKAANTLTNFGGTASLMPLLGAFIADSYAGRFWTITVASIIYQIGMICLTISAVLPKLRPPSCKGDQVCQEANSGQLAILYVSLLLTAIGSGGIRPCVMAFGADQFDETDPKQTTATWKFFNWYYFSMGASMLVAVTVVVYIQDNIGWGWGLGTPTVAMALSIIPFVIGYPLYRHMDPAGSPFTRLIQVCMAAFRKRNLPMVSDPKLLYENQEIDVSISVAGKLLHTKHMQFLDKAAIVTPEDNIKSSSTPNLWRLNTVHRVEELKSLIRMGPIWATGILLITAYVQQGTFSLQQAKTMDRHLINTFQIPAGSMSVFTLTSMLTTIIFYDRIFVPVIRKFTGSERGISFLTRMGIGFAISVLATFVAGFVEIKRKRVALESGLIDKPHTIIPIPVFWLVPQYCLHGVAEAFMSIGHLEFLYDQAPESMRSSATALFWLAISGGSYVSTLLVSMVHKFSAGADGSNWLPDNNLNKGKLEYFYWLITLLQVVNLVYYLICVKFYTFKPIQVHINKGDYVKEDGEVVLGSHV